MGYRILVAPDIHFPFHSRIGLRKFYTLADKLAPTHIIQLGDLIDAYSFSRHPKSYNLMTPAQEIEQARSEALGFWATLKRLAPRAKCHQLLGNHDERIDKKIAQLFPEAESLIDSSKMFSFKGVITQPSERDELIIEDLCFMHGFRSKLGDHARHNSISTICGHSHRGGCVTMKLGQKTIFELNCGHLADATAKALSYTKQRLISNWTLGCGFIDELGPRFIAF